MISRSPVGVQHVLHEHRTGQLQHLANEANANTVDYMQRRSVIKSVRWDREEGLRGYPPILVILARVATHELVHHLRGWRQWGQDAVAFSSVTFSQNGCPGQEIKTALHTGV